MSQLTPAEIEAEKKYDWIGTLPSDVSVRHWSENCFITGANWQAKQGPRWVKGHERLPNEDHYEEPSTYLVRIKGDDPRSGWIAASYMTLQEMRKHIYADYWEWLEEGPAAAPQTSFAAEYKRVTGKDLRLEETQEEENCNAFTDLTKEVPQREQDRELVDEMLNLISRVDKARNILQNTSSDSRGNWGMLDTSKATDLIKKHKK